MTPEDHQEFDYLPKASADSPTTVQELNLLLQQKFRNGAIEEMFDLWASVEQLGITPNLHTYNWLLCAYDAARLPSRCIRCLAEMEQYGIVPSPVSFSIAIKSLTWTGDVEKAFYIYQLLIEKRHTPTIPVFNNLLLVCSAARDGSALLKVRLPFSFPTHIAGGARNETKTPNTHH